MCSYLLPTVSASKKAPHQDVYNVSYLRQGMLYVSDANLT